MADDEQREPSEEKPKEKPKEGINITYLILGIVAILVFWYFLEKNKTWIADNQVLLVGLLLAGILIYWLFFRKEPLVKRDPVDVLKSALLKSKTFDEGYLFTPNEIDFLKVEITQDSSGTYRYFINHPRINKDMTIVIDYTLIDETIKSVQWGHVNKKKTQMGMFNPYSSYRRPYSSGGGYGRPSSTMPARANPANLPPSMR